MAKNKNPFSKAVAETATSKTQGVEQAGADLRRRQSEDELQQATNDGGSNSDVPSAVIDNADAEETAGADLGLGSVDFESAKDRVGEIDLGASDDVDATTFQTPEERIAAQQGVIPNYNIDGMSIEDALDAASGADNTDVSDLMLNPRDMLDAAKAERNPLNDPMIAATMGLVDEQANDRATNPYSVAQGTNTLGNATTAAAGMSEKEKAEFAKSMGVTPASDPEKPGKTYNALRDAKKVGDGEHPSEKGIIDTVADALKSLAGPPPDGGRTQEELKGTDAAGDPGTVPLGEAEAKQGVPGLEAAAAQSLGGLGGNKGGGAKLVNPDDDRSPPTEAEIAFSQALKDSLGIRHIPGDIDPGDGDGTTGGAPVSDEEAQAIVGTKTKESLVGNPGSPEAGARAKAPKATGDERPGLGSGSDQGGDIDFEDGSGFTGGVRTTGPQDVDFGVGSKPLIGLGKGDEEEEEDDDSDDADDDEDEG